MPSLKQICDGEAGCLLNILLFPFVLTYHALRIYIFACFETLGRRSYRLLCGACLKMCCTYEFVDKDFEGQSAIGSNDAVDWVHSTEMMSGKDKNGKPQGPKLYEGSIEAADLCQGAVGDCWLVAALACAAEHPGSIRKAFVVREFNPRCKYAIRLYDPEKKTWVVVTVDDRIPCKKGTKSPIYMKCNGNELWAVLLEKAFAKFCGSYKHLDGGWAMWGWRVLTGDHCFRLKLGDDSKWSRIDFEAKKGKDGIDGAFYTTKERFSSQEVWNLILNYLEDDCFVAASGGKDMGLREQGGSAPNSGGLNGEQLNDAAGLVGTHAYSILDARELGLIPGLNLGAGLLGQTRLIKLRNPWGSYEWKGAWSDGSKEWDANPMVKMRLRPVDADDGCFWMPWDEFYNAGFKQIDICDRTTKDDLKLDVNEDMGACGICVGALAGCGKFWCCCEGIRKIYFGKKSSGRTKSTKRGCQKCMEARDVADPADVTVTRA